MKESVPMLKALIVENNDTFREFLWDILNPQISSLILSEVAKEDAVLSKIETTRPDIVFINFKLLDVNGLIVTQKIKNQYPGIKVVILTNYDLPEYREAAYQFGADYFLSKTALTEKGILDVIQSIFHDLSHENRL
jgi:DNA-binding NarL/FixJ family response regulator